MFSTFLPKPRSNERKKLHCNHCARLTIHTIEAQCEGIFDDQSSDVNGGSKYSIYRCGACDNVCFEISSWFSENFDFDEDGSIYLIPNETYFPPIMTKDMSFEFDYIPYKLSKILDELQYSYGAAKYLTSTILLRMSVEFIVKDKSCTGSNLEKKIKDLLNMSLIDQDQHNLLQKIRTKGNKGAHELEPMNPVEILAGSRVINLLVDILYASPEKKKATIANAKRVLK